MVPPQITACSWICDASCILHYHPILVVDNKSSELLNKVGDIYDTPPPFSHEFYLLRLCPFRARENVVRGGSKLWYAPNVLFILVRMKQALVLEDRNNPFLPRFQDWVLAFEFHPNKCPFHHGFLVLGHQRQEGVISVLLHVLPLMAIHVYTFLQLCIPPT